MEWLSKETRRMVVKGQEVQDRVGVGGEGEV